MRFKKKNRDERKGQPSLPFDVAEHVHDYATESEDYAAITQDTPADVRRMKDTYEKTRQTPDWWHDWVAANLWTAAFFVPQTKYDDPVVPTHNKFVEYLRGRHMDAQMEGTAIGLATSLHFFHWPLEFPAVFERGGFDAVIGNPPWESIQIEEKEFFSGLGRHDIAGLSGAKRKVAIAQLSKSDPTAAKAFLLHCRRIETEAKFIRFSERFKLTAVGKLNTYALFAELGRMLLSERARLGVLLPTGIVTDDNTKGFFSDMISTRQLITLVGFENEDFIFPTVHHTFKFCALTVGGKQVTVEAAKFVFLCRRFEDVQNPKKQFQMSADDFATLNPNTRTCPVFRTRVDAELTKKLYRNVPILVNDTNGCNPWGLEYKQGLFNMTADSDIFERSFRADLLPLYEAKMMHQFDHRYATYENASQAQLNVGILPQPTDEQKQDPTFRIIPRYWVPTVAVQSELQDWKHEWLIGFRDVTSSIVERTAIFSVLPRVGIGHKIPLVFPQNAATPRHVASLLASLNSLTFDYVARQKIGWNSFPLFVLKQLPAPSPQMYRQEDLDFVSSRVLELVYTSDDVRGFALEMGFSGNPFTWEQNRRSNLRAELDAFYAHLYGLTRDELRYVLEPKDVFGEDFPSETFRVLKEREEKEFGEYRTRRLVLEAFDKLAESPRFRHEMPKRESAFKTIEGAAQLIQ